MPDPISLAGAVLSCLGVNVNISAPSISITPPTLPPFNGPSGPTVGAPQFPNLSGPSAPQLPGLRAPSLGNLSAITIPGLSLPFQWPAISAPGFPTMMAGFAGSMLAGVTYCLSFLPPNPHNLPSLPTIDLFIKGFTGAAIGLPALPACTIKIPGAPNIPFPGMPGVSVPGFDPSSMLNMIGMFIVAPFQLFLKIVQSIINLSLSLPSLSTIYNLLIGIGLAIGFPPITLAFILPCVAKMGKAAVSLLG